jgi:predicted enzyme related to lactoylglutathione lyase
MAGERVHGVGGLFVRADDPDTLRQWYADVLGVIDSPDGVWHQPAGPTVFAAFSRASEYFPLQQQCMVNFRVANLDAMLGQLEAANVQVLGTGDQPGVGRFAWIADPEGNRVELWEPNTGT